MRRIGRKLRVLPKKISSKQTDQSMGKHATTLNFSLAKTIGMSITLKQVLKGINIEDHIQNSDRKELGE